MKITPDLDSPLDVLVIGAGPGGAEAAYCMAKRGWKVGVFEKGPLLREKSCGGGIQGQEIAEFGPIPAHALERTIVAGRVYAPNHDYVEIPQYEEIVGATVKRKAFDAHLQDRARAHGAQFYEHHDVRSVDPFGALSRIEFDHEGETRVAHARVVLYAAGAHASQIETALSVHRRDPKHLYAAIQCWVELDESEVAKRVGDAIEIYGGSERIPNGYAWIFPKKSILSVGLGTDQETLRSRHLNLRRLLDDFMAQDSIAAKKVAGGRVLYYDGGLIPTAPINQLVHGRLLFIGDAAGIGCPLHGGGIYQARKSAHIAAEHVERFLINERPEDLAEYDARVREYFWEREGKWDRRLMRFMQKDYLLDATVTEAQRRDSDLKRAFHIILNCTHSHEKAFYIFEGAMLNIVYRFIEKKAERYRPLLDASLHRIDYRQPLIEPCTHHILFADAKRFRATLAFTAYSMFGKDLHDVLPVATAYELLHTASLLHDDIIDDAPRRRGQETTHVKWGIGAAITAGDFLIFQAFQVLSDNNWSPELRQRISELFSRSGLIVCEGEAMDIHLSRRFEMWSVSNYMEMIKMKTGALIESPLVAGAMVAAAPAESIETMREIGRNLGMAFQIIDDANDMLGDEEVSLKSLYTDLRAGKCTVIMAHLYEGADPRLRLTIERIMGGQELAEEELRAMLRLCRVTGAVSASQQTCRGLSEANVGAISKLPNGSARRDLQEINATILDWSGLALVDEQGGGADKFARRNAATR